ncbi:MAG: hypothetical protein AB8G95_27735 [Anaerolineae bacterium]
MTKHNSRIVTFIVAGVLIIGLVQFWQAWVIYARSPIAASYGVSSIQLQVRIVLTFMWGCIWIWQAFQLYRHQQSNRALLPLGSIVILYTLYRLVLAVISPSVIDQQRWVLLLVLAIIALGIVISWGRRHTRLS